MPHINDSLDQRRRAKREPLFDVGCMCILFVIYTREFFYYLVIKNDDQFKALKYKYAHIVYSLMFARIHQLRGFRPKLWALIQSMY